MRRYQYIANNPNLYSQDEYELASSIIWSNLFHMVFNKKKESYEGSMHMYFEDKYYSTSTSFKFPSGQSIKVSITDTREPKYKDFEIPPAKGFIRHKLFLLTSIFKLELLMRQREIKEAIAANQFATNKKSLTWLAGKKADVRTNIPEYFQNLIKATLPFRQN